ncbi:hypothetical protein DV735_g5722, partial [Chaetothyriales sp. CBS 134920]
MSSSSPGLAPHGDADVDAARQASVRTLASSDDASTPPWGGGLTSQYRQDETRHSISSSSSSRPPIKRPQQAHANTTTDADTDSLQSHRRTPNRDSGGFLLGPLAHSAPAVAPLSHANGHTRAKGKRKNEESTLVVPKRRLRTSLIGSSPLSKEVRSEETTEQPSTTVSFVPHDNRNVANNNRNSTAPPVAGLNTDPANIVNMALTLSQARKRIASEKRYVSAEQAQSRTLSGASATPQEEKERTAEYVTVTVDSRQHSGGNNIAQLPMSLGPAEHSQPSPPTLVDDDGQPLQISPATAHRVQKVKNYFELAYEHRRLLSHLPPIARPGSGTPYHSKQYNPLQYIRNRKLRIWDRTTIDAEEDGWYDIDKVRHWVTSVIESHPETVHEPDECVRLPPLSKAASSTESDSDAKRLKKATAQKPRRRRPRSDWVTHPGDLIADCFWLEQGVNKVKILDRDNRRIYPAKTQFRFAGWRNTTPLEVPESVQRPQTESVQRPQTESVQRQQTESVQRQQTESVQRQQTEQDARPRPNSTEDHGRTSEDAVVLPTFTSTHNHTHGHHDGGKMRRRKGKVRRRGLKMFMDDSDSLSDSSRSPGASEDEEDRGRKRMSKKRQKQVHPDDSSAPATLLQPTNPLSLSSGNSRASSAQNSNRLSIDHSLLAKLKRDSTGGSASNRLGNGNRNDRARQESAANVPRSSAEYDDSTAPNSPMATASKGPIWPSIVINLDSPPPSRAPSPSKKLKALNLFQDRSNTSKRDGVSRSDFATESNEHGRHDREKASGDSSGTSPMTRGTSPHTMSRHKSSASAIDSAPNLLSSPKSISPPTGAEHQKIRGIFKGGRIAELVGTEVSRVGHFIWKRHPPASHSKQDSTSTSSLKSQRTYDSGEELEINGSSVLKTPPVVRLQSSSSTSTPLSDGSPAVVVSRPGSSSADRPVYYNANLPSFTSPFQRDKEKQAQLATSSQPSADHISRQAAEHRSASRSPRLNHLAPPKLDMSRSGSPSRLSALSLTSSYGLGEPIDLTNSRAASDKLNTMIHRSADNLKVSAQTPLDLSRASSREVAANEEPESVSAADIDRARALVLSSAIKATEIGRRADISRNSGSGLGLRSRGKASHAVDLSIISRKREHVLAAHNLVLILTEQGATLDGKMKHFSTVVAPRLHRTLQALEDLVDNKLTPRVRLSADEAGELSTKLNTSSALAVKNLNDAISRASRKRRRGPLRSIRRLFFAATEYTVVALLWAIWAIVTALTLVLRLVKGFIKLGRWMLFLE